MTRTYSELVKIYTFKERYEYLRLNEFVGSKTFGFDRYLNQKFYSSAEWIRIRNHVIVRDNGLDLGIYDHLIPGIIIVHHMNPMSVKDLMLKKNEVLDPEFLITVSKTTHRAIHYGKDIYEETFVSRKPNDMAPWL